MKHIRFALSALAAAALSATAANAQMTPQQMVQGRVARSVQLGAAASVDYDDNVARTSSTLAAQEGIQLADVIYTPSVTANVVFPVGRQALFLDGVLGYVGHKNNPRLDNTHADVNGGVANSVGPCGSVLTGGYARGRSEFGNTILVSNVTDIQEIKRIDLSLACTRKTGLGVFVDGSRSWLTNSIPASANGDNVSTTVVGGLSYSRPSFGTLSLTASDAKTEYSKDGLAALLLGSSGFEAKSFGATLERKLGGRIQASISASYTKADINQALPVGLTLPASRSFGGLTYASDVTFRASSRLQAHAGFNRSVNPSQITGGSFEIDTEYQAGLNYNLGSRITLGLTGRDRKTEVHGDIPIALAATTLTDTTSKTVEASAEYRLNKRISFRATARHETRDADNPLFAYSDNGAGVSVAVKY